MSLPIIGILLGDPAGIGPEIVAKLCEGDDIYTYCRPIIIGDYRVFEYARGLIDGRFTIEKITNVQEVDWEQGFYPILDQEDIDPLTLKIGSPSQESGKAIVNMLRVAMKLCDEGVLDGFAYAPINTISINKSGYNFESEAKIFAEHYEKSKVTSELNVLDGMWVSRVTSHIPVRNICELITIESVYEGIESLHKTILKAEGQAPQIGVAALNPHAGEKGVFGTEEENIILPAIQMAKARGIDVSGPYASDMLFLKAMDGEFNGVVTMYHDQGQIAIKLRGILQGVTLHTGLDYPIVTSIHGAAYDKAGKGIASTDGIENAIKLVAQIITNSKID